MTTSSSNTSTPLPTQNPGPDGRIAPIKRHNNKHGIGGHLWWMLYLLARADRTTVYRQLERALQEYGARRGVFLGPEGVSQECRLCYRIFTSEDASKRLLKRGVYAHDECIIQLDRERAEYIRSLAGRDEDDGQDGPPPVSINSTREERDQERV